MDITSFFGYAWDCLDNEVASNVCCSVNQQTSYCYIPTLPTNLHDQDSIREFLAQRRIARLCQLASEEKSGFSNTGRLVIGYPVLKMKKKGKKILVPVIFWRIKDLISGEVGLPFINPMFIEKICGCHRSAKAFFQSLNEKDITIDFDDLTSVNKLIRQLFSKVQMEDEFIDNEITHLMNDTSMIKSSDADGLYSRVIVMIGDSPVFTAGLMQELKKLQKMPREAFKGTALEAFWSALFDNRAIKSVTPYDGALVENKQRLNDAQRLAVNRSLTSNLSVIQGPPGTGKTQVVKALYLNALLQGQKVVFTSKNTAAVSVVAGIGINDEPITIVKPYEENKQGTNPRPVLDFYTIKLKRLLEYSHTHPNGEYFIRENLKKLNVLHKERTALLAQLDEIEDIFAKMRAVFEGHKAFLSFLPQANVKKSSLYLTIRRMTESITDDLMAYEETQQSSLMGTALLLKPLRLWIHTSLLSRKLSRLEGYLAFIDHNVESLAYWKDNVSLLSDDLKAIHKELLHFEDFQRYESDNTELIKKGSTLEIDRRLLAIDNERIKLSRSIIDNLPVRHCRKFKAGEIAKWQVSAMQNQGSDEVLAKVVEWLPAIAVKSLSVAGRLPLKPGVVDLLIVDEAGQVDTLSMIPLLFRAKRVVVIGDPKQLNPIVNLNDHIFEQISRRYSDCGKQWPFSEDCSFFTLANSIAPDGCLMLDQHFRCHPDISTFVSTAFYGGHLLDSVDPDRMKKPFENKPGIFWVDVDSCTDNAKTLTCTLEADKAVELVDELMNHRGVPADRIGVIVPFKDQNTLVRHKLNAIDPQSQVLVSTAHGFQGGERDVIVYSLCVRDQLRQSGFEFLKTSTNLFNVALTRAKQQLIIVGDTAAVSNCDIEIYRDFLEYVSSLTPEVSVRKRLGEGLAVSKLEVDLAKSLSKRGIVFSQQVSVGRYCLDFAIYKDNKKLNVEVDGEQYHMTASGELRHYDRIRNEYLIEHDWDVMRFWSKQVSSDMDDVISQIEQWLCIDKD